MAGVFRHYSPEEKTRFHLENKTNKTGFLGVSIERDPRGRVIYKARLRYNGKQRYVGKSKTAEGAARLYDAKTLEIHGVDAVVNFPHLQATVSQGQDEATNTRKAKKVQ